MFLGFDEKQGIEAIFFWHYCLLLCRAGIMADPSGFGKKGGEAAKEKGERCLLLW